MTRAVINNSLWIVSLLLQCSLLALLFGRGLNRRIPTFTLLLAFYPLRSAVLYFLAAGHLAPAAYAVTYNGLSIVDLLLQMLVAVEIAAHLIRAAGGFSLRRGFLMLLLAGCALAATFIATRLLPANAPLPPDRLQMFNSLTMILLCVWAFSRPVSALSRRVTLGFAFYGIFGLLTTAARTFAAIHRDAHMFALWSYTLSGVWLAVIAYWIAVLKPDASPSALDRACGGAAGPPNLAVVASRLA